MIEFKKLKQKLKKNKIKLGYTQLTTQEFSQEILR